MFYEVYFSDVDHAIECPQWDTMSKIEQQRYDEECSQCIGVVFAGIVEAENVPEAIRHAYADYDGLGIVGA